MDICAILVLNDFFILHILAWANAKTQCTAAGLNITEQLTNTISNIHRDVERLEYWKKPHGCSILFFFDSGGETLCGAKAV